MPRKPKLRFSTFDIFNILDIERVRLVAWMGFGHITPSIAKAKGAGTRNVFNIGDLHKIYLFKCLIDAGFRRENAKDLINECDLTVRKQAVKEFHGGISVKIDPMQIRSIVGLKVMAWKLAKEKAYNDKRDAL